jgi:hypothetical protein
VVKLRRKICVVTTNICFVAICGQFFCNNICTYRNLTYLLQYQFEYYHELYFVARPSFYRNKKTNSRNGIWLSQYHDHIATFMHTIAIYGLYCNKTCIYHDKTKPWQYALPITTNVKMVAIFCFIATKCGCSNKNCCNRPNFL